MPSVQNSNLPKISDSRRVPETVTGFLQYLQVEKGSSPLTIRNYKHYLNRFYNWSGGTVDLTQINQKTVADYRQYLANMELPRKKSLSKKTQSYHIIALRSFLKWLIKNDYKVMSPEKIDLPKIEERQVKFLSGEQVERLLNSPSLSSINGKRDKAIMEVLFSTGLRVSELTKLDKNNINFTTREFGIVGKGGKARVVYLSSRAAGWIEKYLNERTDHFAPLFIRHKGSVDPTTPDEKMRLTPRSVQRLIKKYVRKAKLPVDATPHTIRHSFATDLLMAGADIRSVQEMLGHKNIATTQIYTHVTNKHLKDVHEAFHDKGGS